jgi:acyl carrier protein
MDAITEMRREARNWIDTWLRQVEKVANQEPDTLSGWTAFVFDSIPAVALFMEVAE